MGNTSWTYRYTIIPKSSLSRYFLIQVHSKIPFITIKKGVQNIRTVYIHNLLGPTRHENKKNVILQLYLNNSHKKRKKQIITLIFKNTIG